MARRATKRTTATEAYRLQIEAIDRKYEPLLLQWRDYSSGLRHEERTAIRGSKLTNRVKGLETALEMLGFADSRKVAIERLEDQIQEPSLTEDFRQAAQMILDDLNEID